MRSKPAGLWRGNDRICWVCLLMEEFVGTGSLKHAPEVLAGFKGVSEAPALQRASKALFNLRQVTTAFSTPEAIRHAVTLYNEHHRNAGTRGAYNIHPRTLRFERIDFFEGNDLANARQVLRGTLAYAPAGIEMADPAEEMSAVLGDAPDAPRVPIPPITAPLRPRRVHDLARTPAGRIEVPIAELIGIAQDMDRRDADAPTRRPGEWAERMRRFDLMRPVEGVGLVESDILVLEDLRHLIGLPGSGKTTLLVVLGVWVGRRGLKAMLLFPSIEVARQYMADLDFYGANVGMLVGQNPATRRHAERIAETIAAAKGQGGFAATLDGADAFGANCVLPAFARGDTGFWSFGQTACDSIFQGAGSKGRPKRRLCPVWTMCGRNVAPRRLLDADIWVGHVLSMDTAVPAHAADEAIRYFELIARCFDVVVFDEADAVQNQLDHHGAATLRISGAEDSVHRVILSQIHDRFARGENHRLMDRNIELYSRQLGEFGNHNYSLVSCVQNLCNDPARRAVAEHFGGHLLTTSRVISEIREGLSRGRARRTDKESWAELRRDLELTRAVTDLWDGAAYEAYDDRNGTGRAAWTEADFCAAHIGLPADDLRRRRDMLVLLFRRYLAETLTVNRDEIVDQICDLLLGLCFADGRAVPPGVRTAVVLLVSVTFMIVGYQRIVPGTAAMVAEGLIPDPVVAATASPDLRRFIPESVMGSLSGVRYSTSRAGSSRPAAVNVELSFITLVGAPRMLMHRFHQLLAAEGIPGPAVLLTSATSFLEPSTTYTKRPDR